MTLESAVARGDLDAIRTALDGGADVNEVYRGKRTPLIEATIDGRADIVALLVGAGARLDHQDYHGFTALHYAAQNCQIEIAAQLLKAGAAVDVRDQHGNTPLFRAVYQTGESPERIASLTGSEPQYALIRLLVAAGADRNQVNKHGQSPLGLANLMQGGDKIRWE